MIRFYPVIFAILLIPLAVSSINQGKIDDPLKGTTAPAATVEMTNSLNFNPDTVVIQTGETVQWKNTSLLVHTVTGDPSQETMEISATLPEGARPFDSGNLDPNETYEHTFTVPGTYGYFCIPHEAAMRGIVIVKK